jgi:hypothetical protein
MNVDSVPSQNPNPGFYNRRIANLESSLTKCTEKRASMGRVIRELNEENRLMKAALNATWEALDGLYGADIGEEIPIDLLPEDRQELFHKALELVGEVMK